MPTRISQIEEVRSRYFDGDISRQTFREEIAAITEFNGPSEPMECPECGEKVSVGLEIGDERFCDEGCAHEHGYEQCAQCGTWHRTDDMVQLGNDWFCNNNCAHDFGWRECEGCGEMLWNEDAIEARDRYGTVVLFCSDGCAAEDGYEQCDRCGEWRETCETVRSSGCEEAWCDECRDSYAMRCRGCGDWFDEDDGRYNSSDEWYCQECFEEYSTDHLFRYGYRPRITPFGSGLLLGVELETDGGCSRPRYCNELHAIEGFAPRFWMTEDGSLDNGVEITSQPMTLEEHCNIRDTIYVPIGETAREYDFVSHNGGRCGLHVHVNRDFFGKTIAVQDAGGYKMMRLLQRFERQFFTFSRRTSTQWCGYKTSADFTPKKDTASILKPECDKEQGLLSKSRAMVRHETSHSQALNFEHSATFEFRIFRGTLKWETYFASLGMVDGLARTAKEHGSIWVESVNWYDLVDEVIERCSVEYARDCLVEYLDEKGLR